MRDDVRISGGLFACLLNIYVHVAAVQYLPAILFRQAKQDAWISVLFGGCFSLVIGWLALWVALRHPGQGPIQIAKKVLGRWVGSMVGVLYLLYFIWVFSLVIRNVVDFSVLILLPGTPGRVIAVLMAALALYGAWHGLEPIARVGFQAMVALAVANLAIPPLVSPQMGMLERSPILQYGFGPILQASLFTLNWFGEAVVVLPLASHLARTKHPYRWTAIGILSATGILSSLCGQTSLVLGPDLPGRFILPIYLLIQEISIGNIVERVELALVTVWLSGMFVKMGVGLYVSAEGTRELLGLKENRWPAVVIAIAGTLLAHVWRSQLDISWYNGSMPMILLYMTVQLGFPGLLAIATWIRGLLTRGNRHAQA